MRQKLDRRWFENLFGFKEADGVATWIRSQFELHEGILVSTRNGLSFAVGDFSTPSLAELRQQQSGRATDTSATNSVGSTSTEHGPQGLRLTHIAVTDIFKLHCNKEYAGAMIMAASQTNCLEFCSPHKTPEDGITNYIYDNTQGPACALAAPASTLYRNYFVPVGASGTAISIGQHKDAQLNTFADLLFAIQGNLPLISCRNGYTSSDLSKLQQFNGRLPARGSTEWHELMGHLRIGLHANVQVPWDFDNLEVLPFSERNTVSQAYCSAVSCAYSSQASLHDWEPFARLVLDASYEAVLLAAAVKDHSPRSGDSRPKVLLTRLGGGAFGNRDEWIDDAIARACVLLEQLNLDVVVCHYRDIDIAAVSSIEQKMKSLRNEANVHG